MKKQKHSNENPEKEIISNNVEVNENATSSDNQNPVVNNSEEENVNSVDTINALTQKCSDLSDKNLRLMAEFDNYRKRTLKERSDLIKTAGTAVLSDMLPLVDDFERALKAMETTEDVAAVKEGIDLIYGKLIAFLLQNGVKPIPTENEVFDTDLHEAITTLPAPTKELKGKIVDCISKGYTLNDKVIRFSKVVVGE